MFELRTYFLIDKRCVRITNQRVQQSLRIAELESVNAELSTTVDSILTDVLPTLMGA